MSCGISSVSYSATPTDDISEYLGQKGKHPDGANCKVTIRKRIAPYVFHSAQ